MPYVEYLIGFRRIIFRNGFRVFLGFTCQRGCLRAIQARHSGCKCSPRPRPSDAAQLSAARGTVRMDKNTGLGSKAGESRFVEGLGFRVQGWLGGSWHLLTNYNCTYSCTYNPIRALSANSKWVISTVLIG